MRRRVAGRGSGVWPAVWVAVWLAAGVAGHPGQAAGQSAGECMEKPANRGSVSVESNDAVQVFKWRVGRCEATVRMEGAVRLTSDFRAFAGISAGGLVRIESADGSRRRAVEVHPGSSGLAYEYRIDDRSAEFEPEGREWLAGFLLDMYRLTGYMAAERAAWILAERGPDALVAEVARLRGDRARRQYLLVALRNGGVDEGRLLNLAAGIESDHEAGELLLEYLARGVPAREYEDEFLAVLDTIESSHEYSRVAQALLRERGKGRSR
jgi:hypothetical protein